MAGDFLDGYECRPFSELKLGDKFFLKEAFYDPELSLLLCRKTLFTNFVYHENHMPGRLRFSHIVVVLAGDDGLPLKKAFANQVEIT